MPEHIFILEPDDVDLAAAERVLRTSGWPSVHVLRSADDAANRLTDLVGPVVLVADLDSLRAAQRLVELVRLRPSSIIGGAKALLTPLPANLDKVVRKPYDEDLNAAVVDQVARLRMLEQMRFVVAVLIAERDNPTPAGISTNGTGCLLELPQRRVLLTAAHVALAIRRSGVLGLLGGNASVPIDITNWAVVDVDEEVDIATIAVPTHFEASTLGKGFYRPARWPPERARKGDAATFVGYPGIHRVPGVDRLTMHATIFSDFVSSVSGRHFIMADEGLERGATSYRRDLEMFGPTGGMSGAPVFVGTEQAVAELRGVLKEGGDGPDATLFVAHSDFILPDGTIDSNLMR